MPLRLATAVAAVLLVCVGSFPALPQSSAAEDPACTGRAPFREVAQDEMRSFAEICRIGDALGVERRGPGIGAIGWARGRGAAPADKD